MLSQQKNRLLADVSPGTPMHVALQRYWWPVLLSRDLPNPDSDPIRVTLLGVDYVAFRDSAGVIGLLDARCSHRGASLCLGRVEDGGIRCLYHGWKFDVSGRMLDAPNAPEQRVRERLRQPSFAVREAGGIVWAYVGPRELEPPFPDLPVFHRPDTHRFAEIVACSANYTLLVEGVLDSSHVGVLHRDVAGQEILADAAPEFEVQDTDFGFRYAALRRAQDETGAPARLARVSAFALPSTVFVNAPQAVALIAVPVTTDRSHFFMIFWSDSTPLGVGPDLAELRAFYGIDDEGMDRWGLDRRTHELPDRPNRTNNFCQDRRAMREGRTFSGMHRFIPEDFGVAQSMARTVERIGEHLVPSDIAIARYRRLMIENAERVAAGTAPTGLGASGARAQAGLVKSGSDWRHWFD